MRIRTTTLTRVGAALLASTLLVAGCADSGGDSDKDSKGSGKLSLDEIYTEGIYGPKASGTPKTGGQLTVGEYAEARSLDPTVTIPNGAVGASAMAAVYDVLMRWDATAQEFVPQLAESLTTEDNKTWTLKLRDGVKFTDGTPLNSAAVAGSIGYYMQNRGFNVLLLATNLKAMTPVDELTVKFELNAPWATFPNMLATGPGMVLAPAAIKGGQKGFKPIGAGPFKLDSYKPAEELILKRNDDYFGEKAYLDSLRFVFPASDDARYDALKNGDYDQIAVRTNKVVETARQEGTAGALIPSGLGMMFWLNNREGHAGSDVRIRKAIAMAIDPKTYLTRAQGGHGIPSRNIYSKSAPYFTEITELKTNIEEAKKLVAEAKADGVKTTLTYIGQSDQASKTASVTVQAMLKEIGLDVKVELLNAVTDQTTRIYVTHDYDMATSSMSIPSEDPFSRFSSQLVGASPANPSGYSNPEMDKLIFKLQGETGQEQIDTLTQINELWQEENPGIAISPGSFFFAWADNVHGIVPTSETMMLYGKAWKS
ncbi:ABC transporter substrate-binding protein [Nocardioides sp. Bht2]|uniref:ABC transporter substrate-binding protein n=1 Tax=Nocardioides sp. Bht2 TaxID=3392297 RepID=UPI0039B53642